MSKDKYIIGCDNSTKSSSSNITVMKVTNVIEVIEPRKAELIMQEFKALIKLYMTKVIK